MNAKYDEQIADATTQARKQDVLENNRERDFAARVLRLHRNGFSVREITERLSRVPSPEQLEQDYGVAVHREAVFDDGDGVRSRFRRQIDAYERQKRRIAAIITEYGV